MPTTPLPSRTIATGDRLAVEIEQGRGSPLPTGSRRGNTGGTPARARASTRGQSFLVESLGLRVLRGRRDPRLPSLPASELNGKEGVVGSSPTEGSAKVPQSGTFSFGSACTSNNVH